MKVIPTLIVLALTAPVFATGEQPLNQPQATQYRIECRFVDRDSQGKQELLGEPVLLVQEGRPAEAQVGDRRTTQALGGPKCAIQVTVHAHLKGSARVEAVVTRRSGELIVTGLGNIAGFVLKGQAAEPTANRVLTQTLHTTETVRLGKAFKLVLEKDDAGRPRSWTELTVHEQTLNPVSK